VLARLEEEVGVTKAEVDRHGTLLRLQLLDDSAIGPVIERLLDLGSRDRSCQMRPRVRGGFGRNDVSELSVEEAGVIAPAIARVIRRFRSGAFVVHRYGWIHDWRRAK